MMDLRKPDSPYRGLWHLEKLGILDSNGSYLPKNVKQARVAVIDMPIAHEHPCLVSSVNTELAIDFFSNRFGTKAYGVAGAINVNVMRLESYLGATKFNELGVMTAFDGRVHKSTGRNYVAKWLNCWQQELDFTSSLKQVKPVTNYKFSSHGTAVAGLIAANPVVIDVEGVSAQGQREVRQQNIPYCGVNPYADIVPISTNFDIDPESLILAFLYAKAIDADVIYIPREIYQYERAFARYQRGDEAVSVHDKLFEARFGVLKELIEKIAKDIPIVCSSGNEGWDELIFPASLATPYNPNIIAVGAVNSKGYRTPYSNFSPECVYCYSGDGEILNCDESRIDLNASKKQLDYLFPDGSPASNNFSTEELLTTDVPGDEGYNESYSDLDKIKVNGKDVIRDPESYFGFVSGTSASSALIAGLVSLFIGQGKKPATNQGWREYLLNAHEDSASQNGVPIIYYPSSS